MLGEVVVDKCITQQMSAAEKPKAPGMKYRHYAPKAPVTVVTGASEESARYIAAQAKPGMGVICFHEYTAQFPGCTLLRTDDFYLPPARRSPD